MERDARCKACGGKLFLRAVPVSNGKLLNSEYYCPTHYGLSQIAPSPSELVPRKHFDHVRNALKNWIEWEREQIKKEGPYQGEAINLLIAAGEAALKATE